MTLSQPSLASLAAALVATCRVVVLAVLMLVFSGSVLGITISLHMSQVFDRVTSMHAATGPLASADRMPLVRDSL